MPWFRRPNDCEPSRSPQENISWILGLVQSIVSQLNRMEANTMATLADIQAALSAEKSEEDKIVGLLQAVRADNAKLAADLATAIAANDPAALQAVADQMNANTAAMQAAEAALAGPSPSPGP